MDRYKIHTMKAVVDRLVLHPSKMMKKPNLSAALTELV